MCKSVNGLGVDFDVGFSFSDYKEEKQGKLSFAELALANNYIDNLLKYDLLKIKGQKMKKIIFLNILALIAVITIKEPKTIVEFYFFYAGFFTIAISIILSPLIFIIFGRQK